MLWRCWFGGRKGVQRVKKPSGGVLAWLCICSEMQTPLVQLMSLPLTVSCFSKIQIDFTFLVPSYPGQRAVKQVCVCVCVCKIKWVVSLMLFPASLLASTEGCWRCNKVASNRDNQQCLWVGRGVKLACRGMWPSQALQLLMKHESPQSLLTSMQMITVWKFKNTW